MIAVRGPAVLEVWSNDGGGGLVRTQSVALGGLPFDVVAADLNQDGRFDAVVSFQTSVQLLIHQPTGYVAGVPLPVGGDTTGRLAAADLDQDGDVDVVVGTKNSGG